MTDGEPHPKLSPDFHTYIHVHMHAHTFLIEWDWREASLCGHLILMSPGLEEAFLVPEKESRAPLLHPGSLLAQPF